MASRSDKPMRRRRAREIRVKMVMKPRPPSWIITMMTIWPNRLQWTAVSTMISPVTQVEEVAVKRQVRKSVHVPLLEEMGSISSSAPVRMITAKEMTTKRVELKLLRRIRKSRSQSAILLDIGLPVTFFVFLTGAMSSAHHI